MKSQKIVLLLMVVAALTMAACTRPFSSAPTPFLFPTPDLTLTAMFAVLTPSAELPAATATPTAGADGALPTATSVPPTVAPTQAPTVAAPTPTPTATSIPPTATNPPPPTATATATPVPLLVHPKGQVTAYHFTSSPTLDGDFSEWKDAKIFPAHSIVYGKDQWYANADLEGYFQVGWDADNLYIAVSVTDQLYVQLASGENIFKGDSLEILMDTNLSGDFYVESLTGDDYQLGISPGNPSPGTKPEAYLWFPSSASGARKVQVYANTFNGGYVVEAAIPWSIFGVQPKSGQHYGFALSVSDSDNDAQAVQESMASSVPGRRLTNPTTWGDLFLK